MKLRKNMFERYKDYKLKKELRNMKSNLSDEGQFLGALRAELENHILENPAVGGDLKTEEADVPGGSVRERLWHFQFADIKLNPFFTRALMFSMVIVLTGGGVAMASEGSLPGDSLYPVKLLTEDIRYSVSLSPDSKARLHASFAAKRVSEIKTLLEKKNVSPKVLDQAISRLQYNANSAADALKDQKDEAAASELAKNINEKLNEQKKELRETFQKEEGDLKSNEIDVKEKIREARKNGNNNDLEKLNAQLEVIKGERKAIVSKKNQTLDVIKDGKEEIKSRMGESERINEDKKEISEDIAELTKKKSEYSDKIRKKDPDKFQKAFELFDRFISMAQNSFQNGKYEDSKIFLDNAKIELEKAIDKIEDAGEEADAEKDSDREDKNTFQRQKEFVNIRDEASSSSATSQIGEKDEE